MTHIDPGEPATPARSSRRALLGAGIGTSIVGAALATAVARTAGASGAATIGTDDRELLRVAMELEISARDLYDQAIAAGAEPTLPEAMREQHEAYAQALAGRTGFSARTRNDEVFDQFRGDFATTDIQALAASAYELESIAEATHTELAGLVADASAVRVIASIAVVEARHCAVLAAVAGRGSDLDAMLVNPAEPLSLEDQS